MIDDFCKQLVARHPASIGRWLLGLMGPVPTTQAGEHPASDPGRAPDWQLLDRELSSDALHADSVVLLPANPGRSTAPILHLEFQTRPDPLMAERMLEYWIRLHRRFRRPIRQVVLHLKPTRSPLARIEHLAIGRTRHHFTSLRMWEQDSAPLLADCALLPLAVLTLPQQGPPEQVLSEVRQRLQAISDPDQRRRTTSGCQLLAGLTFSQDVIQRLLAMSILEDSSVYQYIVRKGLAEGRELGRQQEASTLLLRLLGRRCGPLPPQQRDRIGDLPLEQLEALGDALLDLQGPADLEQWLSRIETA